MRRSLPWVLSLALLPATAQAQTTRELGTPTVELVPVTTHAGPAMPRHGGVVFFITGSGLHTGGIAAGLASIYSLTEGTGNVMIAFVLLGVLASLVGGGLVAAGVDEATSTERAPIIADRRGLGLRW